MDEITALIQSGGESTDDTTNQQHSEAASSGGQINEQASEQDSREVSKDSSESSNTGTDEANQATEQKGSSEASSKDKGGSQKIVDNGLDAIDELLKGGVDDEEDPSTAQPAAANSKRSYEGYPPEVVAHLKQMSTGAYEYTVARLKDLADIKAERDALNAKLAAQPGRLPDSYLDLPNAFVLDPEYTRLTNNINQSAQLQAHWKAQLAKIKKGEEWEDIQLAADGKTLVRSKVAASDEAEEEIRGRITELQAISLQSQGDLQELQTGFKQKMTTRMSAMKQYEDHYFPEFKDQKVFSENPAVKNIMQAFKDRGMDQNVLAPIAAKMFARILAQQDQLKAINDALKKRNILAKQSRQSGPSSSNIGGTASGKNGSRSKTVVDDLQEIDNLVSGRV